MTILCVLWLAAFIGTLLSAMGRVPLWVPLLIATMAGLVGCLPMR